MTKSLSVWCAFCLLLVATPSHMPLASSTEVSWFDRICQRLMLKSAPSVQEQTWQTQDLATWSLMQSNFKTELLQFKNLSEHDQTTYLKKVAEQVEDTIFKKLKHKRIGFHFNLHGGVRTAYYERGGIQAQMGDSGVQGGFSRDFARKVYFFNLENTDLLTILTTRNPNVLFPRMRMGNILILFDLNSPVLKAAIEKGVITNIEEIFMDFDEKAARKNNMFFGLDRSAFLMRPLRVFDKSSRPLQLRDLNWDEQTLLYLRFIEAELLQIDPV